MKKEVVKNIIKDNIAFCIMGAMLIFITLAARTLTVYGNLSWSAGFFFKAIPLSLAIGIPVGFLINFMIKKIAGVSVNLTPTKSSKCLVIFFISMAVLSLAFIPYFLAYYPGILAYDSYVQIEQIFTGEYNDHHPLFHTLMIKFFLNIGKSVFNSLNAGIAVYAMAQIIFLAAVFSYGIFCLYKRGYRILSFTVLAIEALFPFNGFMAVSVTKDISFAIFFLLAVNALSELVFARDKKSTVFNTLLLVFSSIMCVLYRNNGRYAFGLLFLVYLIILIILAVKKDTKDKRIKVSKCALIVIGMFVSIVASVLILNGLSKSLNAVQGDRREMLSVPIQQLARTYVYHAGAGVIPEDDNTMDEESKALIKEFILNDGAKLYRQDISDPVKRNTNTWVVVHKTKEFAKVYLKLFIKYPEDYINAFIAQNAGFIDIGDKSHAYVNDPETIKGLGYVQTRWADALYEKGFYKDSKWPALREILDEFADNNGYLKVPVLKYIFMPGIYLWFFILAFIYANKKKNIGLIAIVSLIAGYYATMLFGPAVQLRYVYPVMITVPFLIPIFFREAKNSNG